MQTILFIDCIQVLIFIDDRFGCFIKNLVFLSMHLLIRVNKDKSVQYALGYNAQKSTMLGMAKAQAQRVFVERVFEEGKNIVGMADYQVRSWNGFHRHMALCLDAPMKLTTSHRFKLTTLNRSKLTTSDRLKLTT